MQMNPPPSANKARQRIVVPGVASVDPGDGKRVKNSWYHSIKHCGQIRRWLGTSYSCAHGRQIASCKEGCSKSICKHGKFPSRCKEVGCGGSAFCEKHGRRRSNCEECGGGSRCEHECVRSVCRICWKEGRGGGALCEKHGRQRTKCKDCDGSGICKCGNRRERCVQCKKDGCGGSALCDCHYMDKNECKECDGGGGSICPCGSLNSKCLHCNLAKSIVAEEATRKANRCNNCATIIDNKRRELHSGVGICAKCENYKKAEAHANGSAPPPKGASWETVFFDKILPLITYAGGVPFPHDQRDQRKGNGLGTPKNKRRRDCDTSTNRFPDCLHIRRNKAGHAILALAIECDEDSHEGRDPECEAAKIYDTNSSVQDLLGKEGAAPGAIVRRTMIPFVVIKVNPNDYDGPRTNLEDRIKRTAALVNSYAHMPEAEIEALHTDGPIVHILYYHSKHGAANLAHLAAVAPAAKWEFTVHG